jgi:hypothetical protein
MIAEVGSQAAHIFYYVLATLGLAGLSCFAYAVFRERPEPPPRYLTEAQILSDLRINHPEFCRKVALYPSLTKLLRLHHTAGQWIRNHYSLWDPANPYTVKDQNSPAHPDEISGRILRTVWLEGQARKAGSIASRS